MLEIGFLSKSYFINSFINQFQKTKSTKVYISLGTAFNHYPDLYDRLINGVDDGSNLIIVSAGSSFNRLIKKNYSINVKIFKYVPQIEVLKNVDYFFSHGGNNSTNKALYWGVPTIILPIGGEQGDNARRVEYLQTGGRLNTESLTTEKAKDKFHEIKTNPIYKKNSKEISTILKKSEGVSVVVHNIELELNKVHCLK